MPGLAILPALFLILYAVRISVPPGQIDHWLPGWYEVLIMGSMVLVEQLRRYRHAVPQRSLLARDLTSTLVNLYVTGAATSVVVMALFTPLLRHGLGRGIIFASPEQLGPFWLQVVIILLAISFFRYWMHRLQHKNEFLWKLHSYHHRVTDVRASNVLVSHPIDFALRSILVLVLLDLVGFYPQAVLIAIPATQIYGFFSHCGAEVRGGFLNYLLVTPEVHRWHHSVTIPDGHRYSVNYGVEFAFWDVLFGTFYLPQREGQPLPPQSMGHPSGYKDDGSYLKLLLVPLGIYGLALWCRRICTKLDA